MMPHLPGPRGQRHTVGLLARAAQDLLAAVRTSAAIHRAEVLVVERLLEDAAAYAAGEIDHLRWRQCAARARAALDPPSRSPRAVARLARAMDLESISELAHAYALLSAGPGLRRGALRRALDRWEGLIVEWVAAQRQLPLYPAEGGVA
ncbi:MAG TPA: hypothetical protein VF017_15385 [Thermoanaerobaculia bacterium]|nr:hypothetical protein [Thermoanaerobaculia bacterium]